MYCCECITPVKSMNFLYRLKIALFSVSSFKHGNNTRYDIVIAIFWTSHVWCNVYSGIDLCCLK